MWDNSRVIAVTSRHRRGQAMTREEYLEQIQIICASKPLALILREKDLTPGEYETLAKMVLKICEREKVTGILHNFKTVAETMECDRIHLPLEELRKLRPDEKHRYQVLGTSVHSLEDAIEAEGLGATYLSAGHIFATSCKPGIPPRGLEFLRKICTAVKIPVYGIGGIPLEEQILQQIYHQGAAGACVMSGFMEMKRSSHIHGEQDCLQTGIL